MTDLVDRARQLATELLAPAAAVVEELAAGDLATTFVWLQHLGVVAPLTAGSPGPRAAFLGDH